MGFTMKNLYSLLVASCVLLTMTFGMGLNAYAGPGQYKEKENTGYVNPVLLYVFRINNQTGKNIEVTVEGRIYDDKCSFFLTSPCVRKDEATYTIVQVKAGGKSRFIASYANVVHISSPIDKREKYVCDETIRSGEILPRATIINIYHWDKTYVAVEDAPSSEVIFGRTKSKYAQFAVVLFAELASERNNDKLDTEATIVYQDASSLAHSEKHYIGIVEKHLENKDIPTFYFSEERGSTLGYAVNKKWFKKHPEHVRLFQKITRIPAAEIMSAVNNGNPDQYKKLAHQILKNAGLI